MQDNSTNDMIERLILYMDGELTATEKQITEEQLKTDVALQQRYQQLLAAKQAIKMQGLKQRVQAIQKEYFEESQSLKTENPQIGKRISFFRTFMRAAAILIFVVAGFGIFQYTSTTNASVYNDNYIPYNVQVSRGSEVLNNMADLYYAGNYAEVIRITNTLSNKNQQDYFIIAQAYLHLNNSQAAISNFKQLENLNNNSAEKYFAQETDYYLMLAYIKNGNIDEAEKQLDKIVSDKQHLFYDKAKSISLTKLKILEWKNE